MRPACTAVATSLPALDAQRGRDLRTPTGVPACSAASTASSTPKAASLTCASRRAMNAVADAPLIDGLRDALRPFWGEGVITSEEVVTDLAGRGWTVLEDGRTR
jgi:hypothetical protein